MTARRLLGLLLAGLVLAGCTQPAANSPASRHTQGPESAADYPAAHGIAALRAGLDQRNQAAPYYLALGDSLSQGVQPDASGADEATDDGYPDLLASRIRTEIPGLRLVRLGCSGETTMTMIHGGSCRYPAGSQLAQAVRFLRAHRGQVALITLDIGANDPNSCVLGQPVSHMFSCLSGRIRATERDLATILARIRAAAGPRVLIVGMNYYVPELGLWDRSQAGKELAILAEGLAAGGNQLLVARYRHYGARVANVFAAFKSTDFKGTSSAGKAGQPPNVAAICSLTWMCAAAPRGPNEHANPAGYLVIAGAFWKAITS
jgi:lysophospholipase L1-like esterase